MQFKNSKFLLIGLLVLSVLISISAINATDDDAGMNAMKTVDNTQDIISTHDIVQKDSAVKLENKNTTKSIEKTVKENKKIKTAEGDANTGETDPVAKKDIQTTIPDIQNRCI